MMIEARQYSYHITTYNNAQDLAGWTGIDVRINPGGFEERNHQNLISWQGSDWNQTYLNNHS